MNILFVGPADTKDKDGIALVERYREFLQGALGNDTPIILSVARLDDFIIKVSTTSLTIFDSANDVELSSYDALFFRGHGFGHLVDVMGTITEYAKIHGIRLWNEYPVIRDSSKLLQNVHFHLNGMPIPETLYVNRAVLTKAEESTWQFPAVLKMVNGSLGLQNYVVQDLDAVRKIVVENPKIRYILQQMIPNDGDFRLLVAGEKMLIFKRIAAGDSHVNNTSQGASATVFDESDLPDSIIGQAKLISRQYGMTFSGVDVMQNVETGDYYFLEVNMQPQMITGALLEEKQALLAEFFKDLAK